MSSLMSNFSIAQEALETSLNSSGSAMKEHEKWQKSLEAQLLKLKAAWQSLSQSFLKSDFLKDALDIIIKFIDFIDKLISKIGALPTLLGGFAAYKGITKVLPAFLKLSNLKSFQGLNSLTKVLMVLRKSFPSLTPLITKFTKALKNMKAAGESSGSTLKDIGKLFLKNWKIAVIVAAVVAITAAYANQKKRVKELASEVEELTDKYKEQHGALIKAKGDYDTSNEDSMISKYEKLSKGVNSLGENVSLTTDEYSEYRSIVDSIANQIPSLVMGYNSQGTAILSCAGNVDELTRAYNDLIIAQNNEVLKNGSKIFEDFANGVNKYKIVGDTETGEKKQYHGVADYFESVETILGSSNIEKDIAELNDYQLSYIAKALEGNGFERNVLGSGEKGWETYREFILRAMEEDASGVKKVLSDSINNINTEAAGLAELTSAYFDNAFLGDYSHMSDRIQGIVGQIADSFDAGFYAKFLDSENPEIELEKSLESILNTFNNLDDNDTLQFEAAFDLKTKFNNGEISYGEYVDGLANAKGLINNLDLDDDAKAQIKLALNTDETIKEYNALKTRLQTMGLKESDSISFLKGLSASQLSSIKLKIEADADWKGLSPEEILKRIEEEVKLSEALNFSANIELDKTSLEAFNTALEESASAMGLSSESIKNLESKYADLEGYDPSVLFERTANGVKVNREELAKLEKQYNDLSQSEVEEHLQTLADKYNDVTAEIDKCTNAGERAELIAEREGYADKIEELATYQAQLEGVTGAYQRWIDAQAGPEDYDGYEGIATNKETVKDEIKRGFIGNASKQYIDLLSGKDLQGGTIDDYANAWDELDDKVTGAGHSIMDFFTVNDDGDITATGIDRFFKSLQTDFKGSVATFNEESGKWEYDFSEKNLQKIQDEWGMGIEAIEVMLEAAVAAGYDIDWGGILDGIDLDTSNFETLVELAESAQSAFNKLDLKGIEDVDFNFTTTNVEEATSELDKAQKIYKDLITNKDGTINLNAKGADEMRVMLSALLIQKQQLEDSNISLNIDTSKLDESQQDIAKAIEAVQNFREKYKNLEIAVTTGQGIDEAKAELSTALGELQGLGDEGVDIAAQLILGEGADGATLTGKVDAAIAAVGEKSIKVGCTLDETAIGTLNSDLLTNFTPEATVKITGIDDSLVGEYTATEKTANGKVKWDNDTSLVVQFQSSIHEASGEVKWKNDQSLLKLSGWKATGTVTWTSGNNVQVKVISKADGTAHSDGTAYARGSTDGRSFARGNWGIDGNGVALGGELGQEIVVRDGRFFTIGDSGAEFFRYKKNDIIFNAAQTEALFKYGGIKGANPRGKMLASGSAFAEGNTISSGRAFAWSATGSQSGFASNRINSVVKKAAESIKKTAESIKKSSKKRKSSSSSSSSSWSATGNESNFASNRQNSKSTSSKKSSSSSSSSKEKDEFEETFDWIETAIDRIERAIDKLDKKASNVYKKWSTRNSALTKEIGKVQDEINLQQKAYDRYIKEANSVGLSSDWAEKVRNGEISIDDVKDEALAEKIKEYTEW